MLVPAGLPLNLPGVFPGATPAFVAMSVYDDSGTTPVLLLSPVPMQHVVGQAYVGKFTPAAGKLYSVFMGVYTDALFTTLDAAFDIYQQSYAIQAQYIFAQSNEVVGAIGGSGACGAPFPIFLGDDKIMALKVIGAECDGGDPLDLTTCINIVVRLPNQDGTFTDLAMTDGDVVIAQPPILGKFSVPITSEVSALLNVGVLQDFDVTFSFPAEVVTVRYYQALSVFEVR